MIMVLNFGPQSSLGGLRDGDLAVSGVQSHAHTPTYTIFCLAVESPHA